MDLVRSVYRMQIRYERKALEILPTIRFLRVDYPFVWHGFLVVKMRPSTNDVVSNNLFAWNRLSWRRRCYNAWNRNHTSRTKITVKKRRNNRRRSKTKSAERVSASHARLRTAISVG